MKKYSSLLTAVLASACSLAFASDITVYGVVDSYVQVYNGGNGTVVDIGSGGKGGSVGASREPKIR